MKNIFALLIVSLFFGNIYGQVSTDSELYKSLLKQDSITFDEGFNQCNMVDLEALLTEDLEFYHDKGGFQNKQEFMEAMKANICGDANRKPIRKLTPNTFEVFPMYHSNGELYGTIAKGSHEFYMKEPGKELYQTGTALFSGLWMLEDEKWMLKRVYSYDHKGVNAAAPVSNIKVSEEKLMELTGVYKAPNTGLVRVTIVDGNLTLNATDMKSPVFAKSDLLFFHKEAPLEFEFIKDEKGNVIKFVVIENGTPVEEAIKQ